MKPGGIPYNYESHNSYYSGGEYVKHKEGYNSVEEEDEEQ